MSAIQASELKDKNGKVISFVDEEARKTAAENGQKVKQLSEEMAERGVTPQMFGAVGDGVTDDTAAFQSAVDSGCDVLIPAGHYRCSNICITNKCRIIGVGDVKLTVPDTVNIPSYDSYTEDTLVFKIEGVGVQVENIHFNGNYTYFAELTNYDINAKFSSYGVRVKNNCENIIIRNCKFNNFKDAGVQITSDCVAVKVEDNIFFDEGWPAAFNRGIQVIQSSDGHMAHHVLKGNQIYNCGEHGIVVYYNNDYTSIINNYILLCGLQSENPDGSTLFTAGACIKSVGCSNLLISGNHCEKGAQGGIIAPGYAHNGVELITHGLNIVNNHCIGEDADDFKGDGISIGVHSENNNISGNIIERVKVRAYQFSAAITAGKHATVTSNEIYDCDNGIRARDALIANNRITASAPIVINSGESIVTGNKIQSAEGKEAIALHAPANTVVSGNTISTAGFGVIVRTSADNVQIYGNTMNAVTKAVEWRGITPTNCKVDFVDVTA